MGCNRSSESPKAAGVPASTPTGTQPSESPNGHTSGDVRCKKSDVFNTPSSPELGLQELMFSIPGENLLSEVHVHQTTKAADGTYVGGFYGVVKLTDRNGQREGSMKFECNERSQDTSVLFNSHVMTQVPTLIHAPSGRITVFDEGSNLDNPQFNIVYLPKIYFDSEGQYSLHNELGNSGPPYLTNRYFRDLIPTFQGTPHFYLHDGGGFEMHYEWSESAKALNGAEVTNETSIVVIYLALGWPK
jgi:hypothetical protein